MIFRWRIVDNNRDFLQNSQTGLIGITLACFDWESYDSMGLGGFQ
jgi:hypothetical protein